MVACPQFFRTSSALHSSPSNPMVPPAPGRPPEYEESPLHTHTSLSRAMPEPSCQSFVGLPRPHLTTLALLTSVHSQTRNTSRFRMRIRASTSEFRVEGSRGPGAQGCRVASRATQGGARLRTRVCDCHCALANAIAQADAKAQ